MNYFKLIKDDEIIGAIDSYAFRAIQKKHNLIVYCSADDVEFVEYNGKLYRAEWMAKTAQEEPFFTNIDIVAIDKEEYDALAEALETMETVEVEQPEEIIEETIEEELDATIEFLQDAKVEQMSKECQEAIFAGFDIVLSDNLEHHFSLTTEDQINLITLSQMIAAGSNAIPYHADGEACGFFSNDDAKEIMETATEYKMYHLTYFNSLRQYIYSLEDVVEIYEVTYGMQIPEEFQSDVLKEMIY